LQALSELVIAGNLLDVCLKPENPQNPDQKRKPG